MMVEWKFVKTSNYSREYVNNKGRGLSTTGCEHDKVIFIIFF